MMESKGSRPGLRYRLAKALKGIPGPVFRNKPSNKRSRPGISYPAVKGWGTHKG